MITFCDIPNVIRIGHQELCTLNFKGADDE